MNATHPTLGLRERKKRRTRETIVAVATRLFVEQGYDATTTAQIADAVRLAAPYDADRSVTPISSSVVRSRLTSSTSPWMPAISIRSPTR